jgi:hypothetical protein
MDTDEREICSYLQGYPGQFIAVAEIARRAGGRRRFQKDPHWPLPILKRLVEAGILETDSTGHYKLKSAPEAKRRKKWISPEIQEILERGGKKIEDEGFEIKDAEEPPKE